MKKLHMGTMSYGFDSMDEVAHQLDVAFGNTGDHGVSIFVCFSAFADSIGYSTSEARFAFHGSTTCNARPKGYVLACS